MDLEYAIKVCKTIGECEVGTIRKQAITRLIDEVLKMHQESVTEVDKDKDN